MIEWTRHCADQTNRPLVYASKALTKAKELYTQIEEEILAIVFAMKFHMYVRRGNGVTVETDHFPFVTIIKK